MEVASASRAGEVASAGRAGEPPHTITMDCLSQIARQRFPGNASPIDIVRSTSPSFAPFFVRAYLVLGYFPHPPSASNIAPENQVCKGENKDVIITTLFSEFTKIN